MLGHGLIHADGRLTLAEFLLFTVLKRRIGAPGRRAPLCAGADVAADAALVLLLIAGARAEEPRAMERAYSAALTLLPASTRMVAREALVDALDVASTGSTSSGPLAKPAFIKVQRRGRSAAGRRRGRRRAAVCAALDAPLPPRLQEQDGAALAA